MGLVEWEAMGVARRREGQSFISVRIRWRADHCRQNPTASALVTGVISARFDPATGVVPFPTDLLLSGTRDLTINIPVANPNNFGDRPVASINALDGWSTVAPGRFQTTAPARDNSLVAGSTIRMFQVTINPATRAVTGVTARTGRHGIRRRPGASSDPTAIRLVWPLVPLQQLSSLHGRRHRRRQGRRRQRCNTSDQTYFLTQRTWPLITPVTQTGQPTCPTTATSTEPLLPVASACSLEPLRLITNSHEAAAPRQGIPRGEIVLTWTATTQSITLVLSAMRSITVARRPPWCRAA
ncbi:MAG: hypothetical protein IPK97_06620 [Ahniella sp.]|nr:hypothetical protein [Ahniella sp.]